MKLALPSQADRMCRYWARNQPYVSMQTAIDTEATLMDRYHHPEYAAQSGYHLDPDRGRDLVDRIMPFNVFDVIVAVEDWLKALWNKTHRKEMQNT